MVEIIPSKSVSGELCVPGDKSVSHRAIMIAAISEGKTNITNFLQADDCLSTIECFRKLGIEINFSQQAVTVQGKGLYGLSGGGTLYTGNSGTTTRLLAGLLCGQKFASEIEGDNSIAKRPMTRIITPLRLMGADIEARESNFCPLKISPAQLKGITYALPVASAQLKSCLLLAGLYADGGTTVIERIPSRDHTELMLRAFGADIASKDGEIRLKPGAKLIARDICVPSDISSAAYFIVSGLLSASGSLLIKNVGVNPTRTGIIDVLKAMGGDIELLNYNSDFEPVCDILVKPSALKGVNIGRELMPRLIDELPVIAVAAARAEGKTVITGAEELKVKECDRIFAMTTELKKLGADITATDDGMIIEGVERFTGGADIETYGDHRVAMSMAVAALFADKPCKMADSGCVSISYPEFFRQLEGIRA